MIVIAPHPDLELKLIKTQKELIKSLYDKANKIIPYAAMPLWIPLDFKSLEEAKGTIRKVIVEKPEFDEKQKSIICPVKIESKEGIIESKLDFIYGLQCHCEERSDVAIQLDNALFPLEVKIFRLGECHSPSPGFFELCNTVWKKLT